MRRFHFSLERVRKWRQDQVEMAEMRLRELYADLRAAEAERERITAEEEQSRREVLSKTAVFAEELSFMESFREYAAVACQRLLLKERELGRRISEQRQQLLEAHRRLRVLEGLRDKTLVNWKAAWNKEQEDLAAELFLARHNRKANGGNEDGG